MVTLQEELLHARAAVIQATRDSEAIRNNPAFRRLEPHFCLLAQVHPSLRAGLLAFMRSALPQEVAELLVIYQTENGAAGLKPGLLASVVSQKLTTTMTLSDKESLLATALACPPDRKAGKTLQQFLRRLDDEMRLVARCAELEAQLAVAPSRTAESKKTAPAGPPVVPVRELIDLPENPLPARQRTCAHWEFEGGPRCPNAVAVFPGGKESPYCTNHLGRCQNPQCPNGPDYCIPKRYQFCPRCKDYPRTPSWRR